MSDTSFSNTNRCEQRVWELSISNLIGVCLVVSVLLFSTSVIDRDSWRDLSRSLTSSFAPMNTSILPDLPSMAFADGDITLAELKQIVRSRLDLMEQSSRTSLQQTGPLVIDLRGFHPGDGSASEVRTLTTLAELLRQIDNDVLIGSHGAAPPSDQGKSVHIWRLLWEANLIRAVETADGLSAAGYDRYTPIEATLNNDLKGARLEVIVTEER